MSAGLALLSGVLLSLTSPRPGLCPLAWVALAPLFQALLRCRSGARAAGLGFLAGLGFQGVALFWVYSTCRFAQVPVPAGLLAWASVCSALSLTWALFGAGAWHLRRLPGPAWPWACAALWAAIEFLAARFTPGLGLILLEYTQWRFPSWYQGAALAGPHAVGFLIILWNAALASVILGEAPTGRARIFFRRAPAVFRNLALAGALVLAWWGWGLWVLHGVRLLAAHSELFDHMFGPGPEAAMGIAILQPNIDQYRKWDEAHTEEIRAGIEGLLDRYQGNSRPVLILWPESSVPGWLDDSRWTDWVSRQARRTRAYHLVGAMTDSPRGPRNSAVLYDYHGKVVGRYDKRRRVPFGEYVPLRFLERFIGILRQFGDLAPGPPDPAPLETPAGLMAATICYEAGFPALARKGAVRGARLLVNLTNDGWYKDTWGPYQHFLASRFRAVENRIPVLRAANTGISAAIDPYGRASASLGLGERGVLEALLPAEDPFPRRSLYTRLGDWFGWLCLALCAGAMALVGLLPE